MIIKTKTIKQLLKFQMLICITCLLMSCNNPKIQKSYEEIPLRNVKIRGKYFYQVETSDSMTNLLGRSFGHDSKSRHGEWVELDDNLNIQYKYWYFNGSLLLKENAYGGEYEYINTGMDSIITTEIKKYLWRDSLGVNVSIQPLVLPVGLLKVTSKSPMKDVRVDHRENIFYFIIDEKSVGDDSLYMEIDVRHPKTKEDIKVDSLKIDLNSVPNSSG